MESEYMIISSVLQFLLFIAVSLILLIASIAFGFLYESQMVGEFTLGKFRHVKMQPPQSNSNRLSRRKLWVKRDFRLDKRISGSSIIDDALQEILQYILRDYVDPWCSVVTNDVEFLFEARQALQQVTVNLSSRCKEVDWIPFLTTKIVDNVAAHIRIYRTARKMKWKEKRAEDSNNAARNIEESFFELELAANGNKMSRKEMCLNPSFEKDCLKVVGDFLLELIGPKDEFDCRPVRLLASQILNSVIVLPLLNLLSDPDYINQLIVWMCKDFQITSEAFLIALSYSESLGELDASREMLNREIALLRSHDLGGEDDIVVKQRLSSLLYVKKLVDHRRQKLGEGNDNDSLASGQLDWNQLMPGKASRLYQLPLPVILKNNVALSYLLDFMSAIESQAYLFFLLNAEGWKIAAEQQLSCMELEGFHLKDEFKRLKKSADNVERNPFHQAVFNMQEAATSIYEQYLSPKATPQLMVEEIHVKRLLFNIQNEPPSESWFDAIIVAVMEKMQKDERFMPSFLKSAGYVRLLAELDLLKDMSKSDDEETRSCDDISAGETASLCSFDGEPDKDGSSESAAYSSNAEQPAVVRNEDCVIKASIHQKGVIKDGLSSHAVYAVVVVKSFKDKELNSWTVYRRYSDFYDLHTRMESRFKEVSGLGFPAKRAFNNMDKLFLERRQFLLNEYLGKLLEPEFLKRNPGLQAMVLQFFDHGSYEQSKGVISRKVDSLVNPFVASVRTVSKAVRWTPANLFKESSHPDVNMCSAPRITGVALEESDNVPLRILLFLMDEIFDLQNRNQWLRRRVYYMLREILKAMYGDVFNQKIVDSVATLTSPESVAEFIRLIKSSFWPNGAPAMPRPVRDEATKMRTRVAAKMALLSCIPDEIRHLIGSETTRQGVLRVFELFQNPVLNRRLMYACLEEMVDVLFPDQNIATFFEKLHSSCPK